MKQDCKPFLDKFCESLGEDQDSPLCRELNEHLQNCPDCLLEVDTIKCTVEIYKSIPNKKVPGDVQKRLLARLNLPC